MVASQALDYTTSDIVLYVALDLGEGKWTCAFSVGFGQKPRHRGVSAGSGVGLLLEIHAVKKRFGLPKDAPVFVSVRQIHTCQVV